MTALARSVSVLTIQDLTGPQKVAVLLLYMGEEVAADILGRLTEAEILRVGQAMATIEAVPADVVDTVVQEFIDKFSAQKGMTANGLDYLKRVVHTAVGEDRARRIMRTVDRKEQEEFQAKLSRINPESLTSLMKLEHPQTAAVICSLLGPIMTSKVLAYFPAEVRNDIVYRMAALERVPPEVMDQVKEFIDREIQVPLPEEDSGGPGLSAEDGVGRVADLLNALGRSQNEPIIKSLMERNPRIAEEVTKKMFSFDDLRRIDDRGVQAMLKDVAKEDLAVALKVADESIREKFLRNMSERAAEFLRDDMDQMGPVRAKDVENSQRAIISVALRLEEEGKIVIAPKD